MSSSPMETSALDAVTSEQRAYCKQHPASGPLGLSRSPSLLVNVYFGRADRFGPHVGWSWLTDVDPSTALLVEVVHFPGLD